MNTLETDLELLETYLDAELDAAAQASLQHRLASEANLAAALTELRSQRQLRQAAFTTMEPGDVSTKQLIWRVRGAMLDQERTSAVKTVSMPWSQWKIARVGSAAAACLVVGFFAGRMGRGGSVATEVNPSAIVSNDAHSPAGGVQLTGDYSHFPAGPAAPVGTFRVPITNEYGQVVEWQTFNNPEQAKNFTEDLHNAHVQPQPAPASPVRLVDSPQVAF